MTERDWANLLPELLGCIAGRLTVVDYIHFGAVCTSWGSIVSRRTPTMTMRQLCFPRSPQVPWLMMAGEDVESGGSLTFVNLPDGKSYRISSLPELRGRWWLGSTDGWLVTLDAMSEMRLLNPLTRTQIKLPSATTFPEVEAIRDSEGVVTRYRVHNSEGGIAGYPVDDADLYTPSEFRIYHFCKVIHSVIHADSALVAMAIIRPRQDLAFARAGGREWTILATPGHTYEDVIYYNGTFFAVTTEAEVQGWDLSGPSPKKTLTLRSKPCYRHSDFKKYLVVSCGELLQVWRYGDTVGPEGSKTFKTRALQVYKLVKDKNAWIRVESLGDCSLFLGGNHSLSLSAKVVPELPRNCIFLTDDCWFSFFDGGHRRTRDLGVFSLEDRTFKPYFPRDLQINWPPPMWLMPKLF